MYSRFYRLGSTILFKSIRPTLPTPFGMGINNSLPIQGSSTLAIHPHFVSLNCVEKTNQQNILSKYHLQLMEIKKLYDSGEMIDTRKLIIDFVKKLEQERPSCKSKELMFNAYFFQGIIFARGGIKQVEIAMDAFQKALNIFPKHKLAQKHLWGAQLSLGLPTPGLTVRNRKIK